MLSWCCVCKLTQGVVENVTFHSIPKNDERREKWLKSLNKSVSKTSAVCSLHFKETDFTYKVVGDRIRKFLKPTAFPTLLLDNHCNSEPGANSDSNTVSECTEDENENGCSENLDEISSNTVSEYTDVQNENCCSGTFDEVVSNTVSVSSSCDKQYESTSLNDENTRDSIKRKSSEFTENEAKRVCNPRYIGDLTRDHFTTECGFNIVQKYHETTKNN